MCFFCNWIKQLKYSCFNFLHMLLLCRNQLF
jgi:hypothetical protein